GHEVTVLGSCDEGLGRLRKLTAAGAGPISTTIGDLCDPPFADRSFDVVVALRMMPHVDDWRRLLGGMCRVARWGVLADYPTPASVNALAPALFRVKKGVEGDTRR